MLRKHRLASFWALASSLALSLTLAGAGTAEAAATAREPGASLLIPYFELEIDQADGLTTLFSVSQSSHAAKVLAHGVIWSDWGIPVYSWDFYLAPGDSVSYNVRDLISYGAWPATTPAAGVGAHCNGPLTPSLDAEQLARLRRQLTGAPDPVSGLCSSEPRENPAIATGSITIDVVRDCAHDGVDDPFDAGYFTGESALADQEEVLLGDFFLVDPAADLAEGYDAIPLGIAGATGDTFWEGAERSDLRREPLSTNWRLRFLRGGPFTARTSFFVFHRRTLVPREPASCEPLPPGDSPHGAWIFEVYDSSGERVQILNVPDQGRRTAARLDLPLPDGLLSGTVGFHAEYRSGVITPEPTYGQSLVFGAIEARGRFGAGIFGTPLN